MGRVCPTTRKMRIKQKRQRKQKVARLRHKLVNSKAMLETEKILEKIGKIAPWLTKEELLASKKDK